jgi:hypothetical protein
VAPITSDETSPCQREPALRRSSPRGNAPIIRSFRPAIACSLAAAVPPSARIPPAHATVERRLAILDHHRWAVAVPRSGRTIPCRGRQPEEQAPSGAPAHSSMPHAHKVHQGQAALLDPFDPTRPAGRATSPPGRNPAQSKRPARYGNLRALTRKAGRVDSRSLAPRSKQSFARVSSANSASRTIEER